MREADALRRAPVGEAGQHRARLRHRGEPPGLEPARPEARVEPEPRHGVADAVGADDAQQMRPRGAQDALAPAGVVVARRGAVARAGGDDDGDPGAAFAEFEDQARHRLGRRHDDRQIGGLGQFGQALQHRAALDRAALDVDQMDVALEAAGQQVARDRRADRARRALAPIATTDRGAIILSRLRVDMASFHRRQLPKVKRSPSVARQIAPKSNAAAEDQAARSGQEIGCAWPDDWQAEAARAQSIHNHSPREDSSAPARRRARPPQLVSAWVFWSSVRPRMGSAVSRVLAEGVLIAGVAMVLMLVADAGRGLPAWRHGGAPDK